jgi:peptidoglycan/xylan/chitin deacetylase (PgdA/CDA1 family)
MYHYVRDERSLFPRLNAMDIADFRDQIRLLGARYEIASLETALSFLRGEHTPSRDLCLLTFDDGLRDHYANVLPALLEAGIEGTFFVITSCIEHHVASVHKNHLLMATLDFETYRAECVRELAALGYEWPAEDLTSKAVALYRWDRSEVAAFKYVMSRCVPDSLKNRMLDRIFAQRLGEEAEIARQLYMTWPEVREMIASGMVIGGHSHAHDLLAGLSLEQMAEDIAACAGELRNRFGAKSRPFSYPYGKSDSFSQHTVACVRKNGFSCAFSTIVGGNAPGDDSFSIRRIDPKDVPAGEVVSSVRS